MVSLMWLMVYVLHCRGKKQWGEWCCWGGDMRDTVTKEWGHQAPVPPCQHPAKPGTVTAWLGELRALATSLGLGDHFRSRGSLLVT